MRRSSRRRGSSVFGAVACSIHVIALKKGQQQPAAGPEICNQCTTSFPQERDFLAHDGCREKVAPVSTGMLLLRRRCWSIALSFTRVAAVAAGGLCSRRRMRRLLPGSHTSTASEATLQTDRGSSAAASSELSHAADARARAWTAATRAVRSTKRARVSTKLPPVGVPKRNS